MMIVFYPPFVHPQFQTYPGVVPPLVSPAVAAGGINNKTSKGIAQTKEQTGRNRQAVSDRQLNTDKQTDRQTEQGQGRDLFTEGMGKGLLMPHSLCQILACGKYFPSCVDRVPCPAG